MTTGSRKVPQWHCCKQCRLQVNKGEENICSLDVIDEKQKGIILAYPLFIVKRVPVVGERRPNMLRAARSALFLFV